MFVPALDQFTQFQGFLCCLFFLQSACLFFFLFCTNDCKVFFILHTFEVLVFVPLYIQELLQPPLSSVFQNVCLIEQSQVFPSFAGIVSLFSWLFPWCQPFTCTSAIWDVTGTWQLFIWINKIYSPTKILCSKKTKPTVKHKSAFLHIPKPKWDR